MQAAADVSTIARQDGSQRGHADLIEAVIFDLDGVLIDSESAWGEVRREFVLERGGRWHDHTQRDMMGMSSVEWSRYIHDELGVDMPPTHISAEVAAASLCCTGNGCRSCRALMGSWTGWPRAGRWRWRRRRIAS